MTSNNVHDWCNILHHCPFNQSGDIYIMGLITWYACVFATCIDLLKYCDFPPSRTVFSPGESANYVAISSH